MLAAIRRVTSATVLFLVIGSTGTAAADGTPAWSSAAAPPQGPLALPGAAAAAELQVQRPLTLPSWLAPYDLSMRSAKELGRRASANACSDPLPTCGVGVCQRTAQCVNGVELPCVPGSPTMTIEVNNCDGLDNDCDGETDEGYDDGIACTISTCVNGVKSNIPDNSACDDGEPCTQDICSPLIGCVHLPDPSAAPDPAFDDGNPCTDLRCHQGRSQNLPDDTNIPDDGLPCTNDFCIGGVAYHEQIPGTCLVDGKCYMPGERATDDLCGVCNPSANPTGFTTDLYFESFEAVPLTGWTFQQHSGSVGWHADDQRKYSGTRSLYFGNQSTRNYNGSGRQHASAVSPYLTIAPDMVTQLEFRVWLSTEQDIYDVKYDIMYVDIISLDGTVETVWNSTQALLGTTNGQFVRVYLDLSDFAGQTFRVRFRFDTGDGNYNAYEGAYVDDVHLHTVCCNTVSDCDDGDPCTTEVCDVNQCLYIHTCNPSCTIQPANVMMVLDYSGSMVHPGTPGDPLSKWEASVMAIETALLQFGPVTNAALKLFRTPGSSNTCSVDQSALDLPFGSSIHQIAQYLYSLWPYGSTPIGSALQAARTIFANHPYTDSRYVVLLTDGEELCGGDPVAAARALADDGISTFVIGFGDGVDRNMLNAVAIEGGHAKEPDGPGQPVYWNAVSRQDLDYALSSIWADVVREQCNGIDDDCDGLTDEDVKPVSCSVQCNGVTLQGYQHCDGGTLSACQLPAETELCNGIDDNCNGIIDDPWVDAIGARLGEPCTVGTGVCERAGVWVCPPTGLGEPVCQATAGPAGVEVCDGLDNDCDGLTDEDLTRSCSFGCDVGVEVCYQGAWTGCTATYCEPDTQCDGVDNDGDGITDPLFPEVGQPCDGPDSDQCVNGVWACGADMYSVVCVESVVDIPEVCGGGDEDCDGQTDEDGALGCTLYLIDADGDGYGTGTPRCLCAPQGPWTATLPGDCDDSNPGVYPGAPEVCDGVDNNCNGHVDEDPATLAPLAQPCYSGPPGTLGVGICKAGVDTCVAGAWTGCVGEVLPQIETCDGRDEDCDGVGDFYEPNLAAGETLADHPCASDPKCDFGDCLCVQATSGDWGCILD